MNKIVPIRIPKEVLEKIELLVRLGKYANKSEALRTIITEHLEERKELLTYQGLLFQDKKIADVTEALDEKEFSELCKTIFSARKTSVELIEEQRREIG
ncbi:MAG: ribbon-helix-helix domain-containing protein [Candidatus Bathyarchaeia archaeon]